MSSLNMIQLIGNIGKDVELRYTSSGVAVANVSLATTESWTGQDGAKREETEWHNVVFWKKQAELVAQYCGKGSKIYIEGKLKTRTWEKDGQKHYATDIQAKEVKFLGGNRREESPQNESRPRTGKPLVVNEQMGNQDFPEDVPF